MAAIKTPTQEQFQIVIDTLEEAWLKSKKRGKVDMMEPVVVHENHCGTPMCFAGWYTSIRIGDSTTYEDGCELIARDLGFDSPTDLKVWAEAKYEIWGNDMGYTMFTDGGAFGIDSDSGFSLYTIVKHWKEVKQRALNN